MQKIYERYIKRCFDFFFSLIAVIILMPVMAIIILLLLATGHRSFFFVQKRVGYRGKIFNVLKFKTMTDERDKNGLLLSDEVRLTSFGKWLRKTSLDELPQLFNVIKGDMSLIGPRPLLIEYLPLYSETQKKRHNVRPGISGWAQVNGRNAISWQQKFEYDVWYSENVCFSLDLKILYKTVLKVVKSDGINQKGSATVEPFKGN